MSDVLENYRVKQLENSLKIGSELPLCYVRQQTAVQHAFLFCVEIPWPLLKLWYKLLESTDEVTYIDLLNRSVNDGWVTIKSDCLRIEQQLHTKAKSVKQSYKTTVGRKRKELDSKVYKLSVRRGETESMEELKSQVQECHEEIDEWKRKYKVQKSSLGCQGKKLSEVGKKQQGRRLRLLKNKAQCALWFCKTYGLELTEIQFQCSDGSSHTLNYGTPWKRKYKDLEDEKKKLFDEMLVEIHNLEEEMTNLKSVDKELADYIETLEKKSSLGCQGKKLSEVGKKQQGRRLRLLKNKAQCALWFCKTYGLELTEIQFQCSDGSSHTLNYGTPSTSKGYEHLTENEKNKVEQVLFLLDKFCVGDEVYHELSMVSEGLPKSYIIKQARTNLNKTYHIEKIPGPYPGAMINFTSTLKDHIGELLKEKPELKEGSVVQVKLSGDGARMSRTTNYMMMSFALLQLSERVMTSKYNRTVAIINGPENYNTLTCISHTYI